MNLLYNADNYPLPKTQTKALKDFYSLSKEKQKKIIKKFEKEKIKSDILKTLYNCKGINETLIKVLFTTWLTKKQFQSDYYRTL